MDETLLNHLKSKVCAELTYRPNQHLVKKELEKYHNIPKYKGYVFGHDAKIVISDWLEFEDEKIAKCSLTSSMRFYDDSEKDIGQNLQDFKIEIFLINQKDNRYFDITVIGLDEVIFYVNGKLNLQAKTTYNLPQLTACSHTPGMFSFLDGMRNIRNQYYPVEFTNPMLDTYFEDELLELFAMATNKLAFLFRNKDRVFEELITMAKGEPLYVFLYPRFTNTISEVASLIYSIWDRIIAFLNGFSPTAYGGMMSYKSYFTAKKDDVKKNSALKNSEFDWFQNRLSKEQKRLDELRHPLIHYNITRTTKGTRSAHLIENFHKTLTNVNQVEKAWSDELEFLKSEMAEISVGLEYSSRLIENWAQIQNP
ncbi:MAG TPA: hypothetical protein DIT07_10370 [Sphingobacteriaceae bacterium]|nr:hypothetical protein [Sphingobacteriaceae bacterium]